MNQKEKEGNKEEKEHKEEDQEDVDYFLVKRTYVEVGTPLEIRMPVKIRTRVEEFASNETIVHHCLNIIAWLIDPTYMDGLCVNFRNKDKVSLVEEIVKEAEKNGILIDRLGSEEMPKGDDNVLKTALITDTEKVLCVYLQVTYPKHPQFTFE
jgi:hypothetical protein